jgi:hypothetical protein
MEFTVLIYHLWLFNLNLNDQIKKLNKVKFISLNKSQLMKIIILLPGHKLVNFLNKILKINKIMKNLIKCKFNLIYLHRLLLILVRH